MNERGPLVRAVVTMAGVAGVVALAFVPIPGIAGNELLDPLEDAVSSGITALGLSPLIGAFVLVEIAALLIPRWRRLREEDAGRRRLWRVAHGVALPLAALHAYFVATYLESAIFEVFPSIVEAGSAFRAVTTGWPASS